MKEMEEKILQEGEILPGNILKVGSFLNQQVDVAFVWKMAQKAAELFRGAGITRVMTIEASGISLATMMALALGVKLSVVKKHNSTNVSGKVYSVPIYSYTHGNTYNAVLAQDYLKEGDVVLLVDDFLATGNALRGLLRMVKEAGAETAGCLIAVEKGFQKGGDELRAEGIRVESMAIVDEMNDGIIRFRA